MTLDINSRLTKTLIVLLLIICMMGSCILDAYAGPLLGAAGSGLFLLIAKGLVAAGLVFGAAYGIDNVNYIVNDYWNKQTEAIKNEWKQYALGAVILSVSVWNSLRSYVRTYTTEDLTVTKTNPYLTNVRMLDAQGNPFTLPGLPQSNSISEPPFYADHIIVGYEKYDQKYYAIFTYMGYEYASYDRTSEEITVWPRSSYGSVLYYLNTSTNQWVRSLTTYIGAGNKVYHLDNSRGDAYYFGLNGFKKDNINFITDADVQALYTAYQNKYVGCPWFRNMSQVAIDVVTGGLTTTFDYTHGQTGEKTIYVPLDVDATNVRTYTEGLLDKTYTDIAAETIPTTDPGTEPGTGTDYTNILDALKALITSILTAINTLVDKVLNLPETLEDMLANVGTIAATLTGAISTYLTDIKTGIMEMVQGQQATEYDLKVYNIPDLLKLLVMILLAILVLFLSFLSMVILLRGVPADSSLIPTQAQSIINWIKDYQVPGFNMSFMSILIGFGTMMFLIRFVKTLRGDLVRAGKNIDRFKAGKG